MRRREATWSRLLNETIRHNGLEPSRAGTSDRLEDAKAYLGTRSESRNSLLKIMGAYWRFGFHRPRGKPTTPAPAPHTLIGDHRGMVPEVRIHQFLYGSNSLFPARGAVRASNAVRSSSVIGRKVRATLIACARIAMVSHPVITRLVGRLIA
jgi:hypothetical protein